METDKMETEKSCGAVVYQQYGYGYEFLVIQSIRDEYWGFPKGHIEDGENEEKTAKREVLEETGLTITLLNGFKRHVFYNVSENIPKEVVYFLAKAQHECMNIQKEEIKAYKWVNFENAFKLLTFESVKDVLQKAFQFLLLDDMKPKS